MLLFCILFRTMFSSEDTVPQKIHLGMSLRSAFAAITAKSDDW